MGKRYYCDFCDRSFADSANNRKNHFKGTVHQKMRKLHYDSFKGTCDYGDECKFSHMTPDRRYKLEQQVQMDKAKKEERGKFPDKEPSLDEWMAKRAKRLKADKPDDDKVEEVQYQLPPFLMNIPNLPPSLLPPTAEDYKNLPPCEWG